MLIMLVSIFKQSCGAFGTPVCLRNWLAVSARFRQVDFNLITINPVSALLHCYHFSRQDYNSEQVFSLQLILFGLNLSSFEFRLALSLASIIQRLLTVPCQ